MASNAFDKIVRIGGASGFTGDSTVSVPQLLTTPGLNYIVFDYLAEEVLGRSDEATRAFLVATSILDRLSGPLCDAVTGGTGGKDGGHRGKGGRHGGRPDGVRATAAERAAHQGGDGRADACLFYPSHSPQDRTRTPIASFGCKKNTTTE